MINQANTEFNYSKKPISKQELRERIEAKLVTRGITDPKRASAEMIYN